LRLALHGAVHWRHGAAAPRPLERKHAALLAWLWLEGPTPRSRMAGLLWPDVNEERARGNLRQRLLKLRQEAGELVNDAAGVLSLAAGVQVDPPDPPAAPLLQALEFDDCEAFARWLDGRRETDRERRKREWLAEVREALSSGQGQRLDDALFAADQLLQTDRESEEAYRVLMEVYYLRGDHAAALSAWDRCREMLRQIYGVLPSPATQELGKTLMEAAASASRQASAPTPSAAPQLPATVLRPPLLVGRTGAMQALVDGWHLGHVLVVAGEAGVGKSRLLADWLHTLAAAGDNPTATARVAMAAARPGDAVLPYATLSRLLLAAIDRFAPPLDSAHALQAARLLPRLAALTGGRAEPVRTDYERSQALMALARLLGDCCRAGCVAFVLDDLQFADPATLAALRVLAEPAVPDAPGEAAASPAPQPGKPALPATTALRFALAVRADEAGPETTTLLDALAATRRCTRVQLAPLSAAHAAELLASLGLATLDTNAWASQIWRQVGGNPAFVLESVKLLLTTGAGHSPAHGGSAAGSASGTGAGVPGPLPLPASIEAVIQRRIELLSPRARHLAQLAAIAGSAYSIPLAAAALACAPLELGEPLRELELRQVFYGRQFVHDVIAAATERSVPGPVAEFMHRFVAEHLQQRGGDAAHMATHWRACGEWRLAGDAFVKAAQSARAAALANEHAALLDSAINAYDQDPALHDALFDALAERAAAYESQGHEGLRPQIIARLQGLARTEAQRLAALNFHYGWLTNLGQLVDVAEAQAAIARAHAANQPYLAWQLARMLAWQWAMNDRAEDALRLMQPHEAWVQAEGGTDNRIAYRQARSNIFAFGDRLAEAIAEGQQALQMAADAQDWPNALPAMSNLGVMHYWRGEYQAAHDVLTQARTQREKLYGRGGSGIKIDIHLGAVLYELGQTDAARAMLQAAATEMRSWPDNEYTRTDVLLAHNHLAAMAMALGHAEDAATTLAHDATGVADRFYGRRLTLRLRWQRLFGHVDTALHAELQALATRLGSPFNRALVELELARHLPPPQALAECRRLQASAVAQQRPGLQLHAATLAAQAALNLGDLPAARALARDAQALHGRSAPFDMTATEVHAVLAAVAAASA
jgi:DNA-binding SARP family transcriptional activator